MSGLFPQEPNWEGMTTDEAEKLLDAHEGYPECQCFQCLFARSVKSNGWQEAVRLHQDRAEQQASEK